jgi:hypothetical protein
MKSFLTILQESKKQFEFKLRIANIDIDDDMMDKMECALKAYDIIDFSKPKSMPVQKYKMFPNLGPCELYVSDLSFNYPCTTEQVRQLIINSTKIPDAQVVVVQKGFDDSELLGPADDKSKSGESILSSEFKDAEDQSPKLYGDKFVGSFLKELTPSIEHKLAGEKTPKAKTSNDFPVNNVSPVNKLKGRK